MNAYPEYVFVQSSVAYIDWMRRYYPAIYEGIRRQTAEGRWEPNGGSWIECDGNMTGGECLIRQFVKGQRYLRDNRIIKRTPSGSRTPSAIRPLSLKS